jgi:putative transcriptional regulator
VKRTQTAASDPEHRIVVRLDTLLEKRGMTLTELAERVGVTLANMSVLKNGRAKAIRFNTLTAICRELECRPGDVLDYLPDE